MTERRTTRITPSRPLSGEVTIYRRLVVSDLSSDGARVETTDILRIGSLRAFRLNLGDQTVIVTGRVAHARVHEADDAHVIYTSGIEFVDVTPAVRGAIEDYLGRSGSTSVEAESHDLG